MTFNKAIEVGLAMDQAVSQTRKAVTEVTNLAQSLQEGAGPQIDLALNEAQKLLGDIKESFPNMTDKFEKSKTALNKSTELHKKMSEIVTPLKTPSQSLKSLKNKINTFQDNISDMRNYTDFAKEKAAHTAFINDANRLIIKKKKNVFFY